MKPDVIGLIRDVKKPGNNRFRNQLYIFLVCVVIAVFFWLTVRLSKDYYHTVSFGLRYTQVPGNLLLTGHSDNKLTINMRIQGFDIFSEEYIKRSDKILKISLKSIKVKQAKDGSYSGYLLTSGITGDITSQLNVPFEIYSITPDTLYFTFEKKVIRKLLPIRSKPIPVTHTEILHDSVKKTRQ